MMPTSAQNGVSTARPSPVSLEHHFSRASKKRLPNVLKEYYRFLRNPEMGNFAGGLPYPGNFPFDAIDIHAVDPGSLTAASKSNGSAQGSKRHISIPRRNAGESTLKTVDLDSALQYGGALGYPPLYAWLKRLTTAVYHPKIPYEGGADIMINGGSADGLSKVYELFFNHWDEGKDDVREREGLLVEEFVYAPPVAQINSRAANIVPVKMDDEGMLAYEPGGLNDTLEGWDVANGKRPHVVYLIPTGQNPTSGVLSLERRKELYDICSKFDLVIIEDDPYWNLYYPSAAAISKKYRHGGVKAAGDTNLNGNASSVAKIAGHTFIDELIPSFLSIDTDGRVVRLDSFSKTIAPGCRLGWITAQPGVTEQIFRITDSTTQAPSHMIQAMVTKLLADFDEGTEPGGWGLEGWLNWLEGLRDVYQRRMIKMATVLEENRILGSGKEMFIFKWPMGGMFLWVRVNIENHPLAATVDGRRLMLALWILCTQRPYRILTVPGGDFAANAAIKHSHGYRYLRFCFAAVEEVTLEERTMSFVKACRAFWDITDVRDVDYILKEEDALKGKGDDDREVVTDW